ncbi:MAG: universal stress protein [Thermoplasmata archaeon]
MFEKVLLATDFSPAYERLIKCVSELKEIGTKEVLMTWVVNARSAGTSAGEYRENHLNKLKEKGDELQEIGLKVFYEAPIGFPSQEICLMAQEREVDLIVIGSRGERTIRDMFLGSTTSNVIRITKVPTLVEKIEPDQDSSSESYRSACKHKFKSLLLATDFSENAQEAERMAIKLAPKADKITILSVAETGIREKTGSPAVPKDKTELEPIREKFAEICDNVVVRFETGVASDNVNHVAEEEDATLIIMGKRGKGGIKELLLGSTAEAVSRRSKIPVMLIPKKEE